MNDIYPATPFDYEEPAPYREPYTYPRYGLARRIWRLVYPALIFLGMQVAAGMLALFLAGFFIRITSVAQDASVTNFIEMYELIKSHISEIISFTILFTQAATAAVLLPLWLATRKRMPRIKPGATGLGAGMSALAVLGVGSIMGLLLALSRIADIDSAFQAVETQLLSMPFWVRFVSVVLLAPVVEEICFRGLLVNRAVYWLPKWAVVLISAAAFGIVHLNFVQGINAAVLGAALALLYLKYRSIWVPIAGHAANNLISVVLAELNLPAGAETALFFAMLAVSAAAIVVAVRSKGAVLEQTADAAALGDGALPAGAAPLSCDSPKI
ncbi:MAG: CPBP family intramembrane metalloprotease [Oscillospiraceae bacterium]|jgi:membrane protease YdiL (CAAX protease family)|nr:CPBP family intramembrane metalloprotease [Oscillospiraceae bacterium]